MTIEINPNRAIGILRKRQTGIGKPHNRIHDEAMNETANRIRALEGICGSCPNLSIQLTKDHLKKQTVKLRCLAGYSPIDLYRSTDLGKQPVCPGFPASDFSKFNLY